MLGNLVNIAGSGAAVTNVDDLAETGLTDRAADHALQERFVLLCYVPRLGQNAPDICCRSAVDDANCRCRLGFLI